MEQALRIVVLGWQKFDKASVINNILGVEVESDEYFVKSVKRDGEVNRRKISLINTPCWWEILDLQDSPEVVKQELVCSVFKCEPGPHVFLLVINLSLSFTEENRLSIEKHLSLFGEKIWRHTIVILTGADSLKDKSIEQHVLNRDLQQIIQRCGERYHVFETENKSAGVQELLIKIDDVVAANNGKHFETQDDVLLDVQRKRDENEKKAKARQEMVQGKRKPLKEIKAVAPLSEVRIVLVGWVLSGKTSTVNTIFNNEKIEMGGTKKCTKYSGVVNGRSVIVLDTPSWWKYFAPKFNPEYVQASILESIGQSQQMQYPHAMILVIPIDTSFRNEQKLIIKQYMASLGKNVWRHTIVLFTWGDRFKDISIEQHIEAEGEALQWLIEKCRNRYHVFDNTNKNQAQVSELLQKIDEMVAENSLFHPNTQKKYDAETSHQRNDTENLNVEIRLKDFSHFLNVKFKRKAEEIRRKIENLCVNIMEDCVNLEESSMNDPINYQDKPPDDPLNVIGTLQQDNIPEPIKTLLEREFSRWESIIIDGVRDSLQDIKSSFELSQAEKRQKSLDAVERWLQNYNHYVQHTINKGERD